MREKVIIDGTFAVYKDRIDGFFVDFTKNHNSRYDLYVEVFINGIMKTINSGVASTLKEAEEKKKEVYDNWKNIIKPKETEKVEI